MLHTLHKHLAMRLAVLLLLTKLLELLRMLVLRGRISHTDAIDS